VPDDAAAVVLNVTGVSPGASTDARLGEGGQVSVYAESASLDLVADVSGYFVRAVP
jgi:hypothetical protein